MRFNFNAGQWMLIAVAGLVAAVLGLSLSLLLYGPPRGDAPLSGTLPSTGTALIGGPFELVDHTGREVDQTILEGKLNLVYFGFTFCPDFCPTELANMAEAKRELKNRGVDVRLVFVTIDPERDDQATLAEYVDAFDADIIGLRGAPEKIRQAAQAYKVYYRKAEGSDFPDGYTMDHSTFVYAMDAEGRFITQFRYATDPVEIADRLTEGAAR